MQMETLWLAPTRPAMRLGIPAEGYWLNLYGTFFVGLWCGSPLYWLIGVLNLVPLRALARWDVNFFRILRLWQETKLATMGANVFGAPTLVALPAASSASAAEYQVLV
jgi:type IV secretion system protein VirB3